MNQYVMELQVGERSHLHALTSWQNCDLVSGAECCDPMVIMPGAALSDSDKADQPD